MAYTYQGRARSGAGLAVAGGLVVTSFVVTSLAVLTGVARAEDTAPKPATNSSLAASPAKPAGKPAVTTGAPAGNSGNAPAANTNAANTPAPPALSPSCEAPANDIAANAPLPHLAKALSEHRTLEILAVGSAATESFGESSGVKSYPVQIENLLKVALKGVDVDVINRGTGGEVAQTSADRIRSEAVLTKPDLVLWQLGTNDALARISPEQFTDTVKSTIAWLKAKDIDVVLVGLQYTTRFAKDENYFAIKRALDRIAKEENILYVKRYDAMKFIAQTRAKVHLMTNDNYHLSDLGTQCMAEHVARAMVGNLFLRRFRPAGAPGAAPPVTSN